MSREDQSPQTAPSPGLDVGSGPIAESVARSLRWSLADAFLYSLMVGVGETYLPAFALSVGLGPIFAGVLSSLPLVSGAVLQLFTPKGLQKVGSHKAWVVLSVVIQALAFLPLIFFASGETPHFGSLFIVLTLYWGAGFAAGSAWNYWMGYLVPEALGQRYFAQRARVSQIAILIGLVAGGVALHNKVTILSFSSVFAGLFFVALVCRLGSSFVLSRKIYRAEWELPAHRLPGWRESWSLFWRSRRKRKFFLLLFPYMATVYVSAPFVTPYFLAQLKLDYGAYMIAIVSLMIGKIVALAWLGRGERFGSRGGMKIFILGVLGISPTPALWFMSTEYAFVLGLQFFNGLALAAFEVGLSLIFFRDLEPEEKVPVLTVYNLFNAGAVILGTLTGGWLLSLFGENARGYWLLFAVGGLLRVAFSRPLISTARAWDR